MKACVYARVSTDEQIKGYSIEYQIKVNMEKARELGATGDIEIFVDEGYGGDDPDRPALNAMVKAIENKKYDLVICYDLDRWARDLADQILFARIVEEHAILEFVTHSRGDKESPEDTLFFHMKGAFAQYEKSKIRQRTMYGRRAKAEKGLVAVTGGWKGHPGPFGYDYDKEKSAFAINEKEAKIVKLIYNLCDIEGMGISKIVIYLNENKIPSPKGCRWHTSTVGRILRNEAYAGVFNNFKRKTKSLSGKLISMEIRPENQWVKISIPAIILRKQWDKVQYKISQNAAISKKQNYQYLLQGHIFCGECGRRVYTTPKKKEDHVALYYRCSGSKRDISLIPCILPMFPANTKKRTTGLDDLIWTFIEKLLKDPDLILAEIAKYKENNNEEDIQKKLSQQLKQKENQSADLEKQVDEAFDMRLEGYLSQERLKKRLNKIELRRKEIAGEIQTLNQKITSIIERKNFSVNIEQYCKMVADKIDNLTFEEKKDILRMLDIKVFLFANKKVEIEWPFSSLNLKVGELSHYKYCRFA